MVRIMKFNGYVEARKIDRKLTKLYAHHNSSDINELREIARMVRTIKSTCELIERATIAKMEDLAK